MFDVETLHDLEKKVLLTIKDIGEGITHNDIQEKSGLGEAEVNRAIEWLREKNLIKVDEISKQKFRFTQLGEKCAKHGMPEKRFLLVIKEKPHTFQEVKTKANLDNDEFNVSIGFLKKENLIEIVDGKAKISETGIKRLKLHWPEEELFKSLKGWMYFDEILPHLKEIIPFLKSRGIVEEETSTIRTIYLGDAGKAILPKIKMEDKIDLLTPQMILSKSWKNKKFRKYEISLPSPPIYAGKKQPYLRFVEELKHKLVGLGFEETKGPFVELSLYNNELLYMPQDHPAREVHDMYMLKNRC